MEKENCYYVKNGLPNKWYNIQADLPEELPEEIDEICNGQSKIDQMNKIRVKELVKQDKSKEKWIDIPEEVIEKYQAIGRPTPLMRAIELEKYLDTPAEIYIKREDLLPTHSFKLNSAIAQSYYAKNEGFKGVISESGAGQWGLALSYATSMYDLKNCFFWVKVSREQKPFRADWCSFFGAKIINSPSNLTTTGQKVLSEDPNSPGSLGISIGEAIEFASKNTEYAYVSGSNLPHVLLHQTIIGLEVKEQLRNIGVKPDTFIACCGGGSNLGGFIGPFIFDPNYNKNTTFLAIESDAAPRLTKGEYEYDNADPYALTPLTKSYTLGRNYMPPPIHVGGLRQHNGSGIIGMLRHNKLLDAIAYSQEEVLQAGKIFMKCYGMIPAPESSHAIKAAIDIAIDAKKNNEKRVIVLCMSGNGVLDINAYKTLKPDKQ